MYDVTARRPRDADDPVYVALLLLLLEIDILGDDGAGGSVEGGQRSAGVGRSGR